MPRKLSAIRQFSLQCDTPPQSASTRRASLKKQHSEELTNDEAGIRISLSAKAAHRNPKHSIKVAWGDNESQPQPFRRHSHQSTLENNNNNDTALYSRKDLAQKLHIAWQERENTKNKLNIFLAHNFQAEQSGDDYNYTPRQEPKLMQPLLLQTDDQSNTSNLKQIFQKHLRKSKIASPVGSDSETISQAVVVVPIIERTKSNQDIIKTRRNLPTQESTLEKSPPRPQTASSAAQKRAMFQKRTNSAFTSINPGCASPMQPVKHFRPPLVRASSLPTSNKPDIQVKTRLRRKIKATKRAKQPNTNNKDVDDDKKSSDVVTMVSLVSPSESEADEELDAQESERKADLLKHSPHSPKKQACCENKHFSLRKTVKQVSFQHSSIHAVRSFSASFPARRGSVGANLLLDSAAKKLQKSLEKRAQPDEGLAEAKRRLLQHENAIEEKNQIEEKPTNTPSTVCAEDQNTQMTTNGDQDKENHDGAQTETVKERKCWETYCRMTKSGLNVSLDTILRGMLTPTEYRLRRRFSLQRADENQENEKETITNEE